MRYVGGVACLVCLERGLGRDSDQKEYSDVYLACLRRDEKGRQTDKELEMPKTRREEGGLGDWSSTGTFLRKPSSGWLHDDHELQEQSSINYKIKVSPSLCLSPTAPVRADPPVDQCKHYYTNKHSLQPLPGLVFLALLSGT